MKVFILTLALAALAAAVSDPIEVRPFDEDGEIRTLEFDGDSLIETLEFDADGQIQTLELDADGQIQTLEFDPDGQIQTLEFDGDGEIQTLEFDADGQIQTLEFDADGQIQTLEFDADGQIQTLEFDADSHIQTLEFDSDGEIQTLEFDADGQIQTLEFDADGEIQTREFDADGEIQTLEFEDDTPEWTLVPDGNGHFHYIDAKSIYNEPELEPFFNPNNDVIFRVFTRRNPTAGQVITWNNLASLTNSQYNSAHATRFIIHGWNNNGGSQVNTAIRTAYINRGEFNVITVDWGVGAQTSNYAAARNRINDVAAVTARLIDWMNQVGQLAFNRISVIGHSLGGHAAGIVGKRVSRGRLHTVIALDPALPLFSMNQPTQRVAPTDAEYVEVMHTNAGLLGFDQPIGIADFYPNWGRTQPGCGVDLVGNCAHGRAHQFFAESINTARRFMSTQCASYAQILNQQCTSSGPQRLMGAEPSQHGLARGVYFVATNAASPFARG